MKENIEEWALMLFTLRMAAAEIQKKVLSQKAGSICRFQAINIQYEKLVPSELDFEERASDLMDKIINLCDSVAMNLHDKQYAVAYRFLTELDLIMGDIGGAAPSLVEKLQKLESYLENCWFPSGLPRA